MDSISLMPQNTLGVSSLGSSPNLGAAPVAGNAGAIGTPMPEAQIAVPAVELDLRMAALTLARSLTQAPLTPQDAQALTGILARMAPPDALAILSGAGEGSDAWPAFLSLAAQQGVPAEKARAWVAQIAQAPAAPETPAMPTAPALPAVAGTPLPSSVLTTLTDLFRTVVSGAPPAPADPSTVTIGNTLSNPGLPVSASAPPSTPYPIPVGGEAPATPLNPALPPPLLTAIARSGLNLDATTLSALASHWDALQGMVDAGDPAAVPAPATAKVVPLNELLSVLYGLQTLRQAPATGTARAGDGLLQPEYLQSSVKLVSSLLGDGSLPTTGSSGLAAMQHPAVTTPAAGLGLPATPDEPTLLTQQPLAEAGPATPNVPVPGLTVRLPTLGLGAHPAEVPMTQEAVVMASAQASSEPLSATAPQAQASTSPAPSALAALSDPDAALLARMQVVIAEFMPAAGPQAATDAAAGTWGELQKLIGQLGASPENTVEFVLGPDGSGARLSELNGPATSAIPSSPVLRALMSTVGSGLVLDLDAASVLHDPALLARCQNAGVILRPPPEEWLSRAKGGRWRVLLDLPQDLPSDPVDASLGTVPALAGFDRRDAVPVRAAVRLRLLADDEAELDLKAEPVRGGVTPQAIAAIGADGASHHQGARHTENPTGQRPTTASTSSEPNPFIGGSPWSVNVQCPPATILERVLVFYHAVYDDLAEGEVLDLEPDSTFSPRGLLEYQPIEVIPPAPGSSPPTPIQFDTEAGLTSEATPV